MMIRPALAADTPALCAIDSADNPSPWKPEHFQAALNSAHDTVLLYEANGQTAAFIVWQHIADEIELHLIATAPQHRRKGLARLLLQAMFQAAAQRQAKRILLEVRAGNAAAQSLYRNCGFVQTALRRGYYRNLEDAVIMEKLC